MLKINNILGEYENEAYRTFEKKEYVEEFINGQCRFGCIYKYKKIENPDLRDVTEGESHIKVGNQQYHGMFAKTTPYVLCLHRSLEAALHSNFGPYIVKISNPKDMAFEIAASLSKLPSKFWGGVEGVKVQYNKGTKFDSIPDSGEWSKLMYSQKPFDKFHTENEFRFAILSNHNIGDTFVINIDSSKLSYEIVRSI